METIIRNVRDLKASERNAAEQIVGHELTGNQQLIIGIKSANGSSVTARSSEEIPAVLPEGCDVCQGLSDQEIDELEGVILNRANLSRQSE
jgi:hypothetical protein